MVVSNKKTNAPSLFYLLLIGWIVCFSYNAQASRYEEEKKQTKIIATVGPSSDQPQSIRNLINNGVNVFRFNFSHGTHEDHKRRYLAIKKEAKDLDQQVAYMVDLQGPKLRVGKFKDDKITLIDGDIFYFDLTQELGTKQRVTFPHKEIYKVLKPGIQIMLDDGKLLMEVLNVSKSQIKLKVVNGGELSNNKGVNIPDITLPVSSMTQKDFTDLDFALTLNPDWVALSFVQTADDVNLLRKQLPPNVGIVSKIEMKAALENLEEITEASDVILIARGDLSIEVSPENLFVAQNKIFEMARKKGKPVIVATQMMESMIKSPKPTNAEITDVSYAVHNMADAVMLSGESSIGKYPVQTVKYMSSIIKKIENARKISDYEKFEMKIFDELTSSYKNANKLAISIAQFATTNDIPHIVVSAKNCDKSSPAFDFISHIAASRPVSNIIAACENNGNYVYPSALLWGTYQIEAKLGESSQVCNLAKKELSSNFKGDILLYRLPEGKSSSKALELVSCK